MEYAVIEAGGKQYTVHPGDTLDVEKIASPQEGLLELGRVLLLSRDGHLKVGQPLVEGAKVVAQIIGQGKAPKVTAFKFKSKTRYRRKRGHRQPYTRLKIMEIVAVAEAPSRMPTATSSEVTSDGS
ncbi:MAG: rplU [Dehalococcoidia bacterium]|nr:rplU [Dehalococcoidia bacterium]